MKKFVISAYLLSLTVIAFSGCVNGMQLDFPSTFKHANPIDTPPIKLSFFLTNDIHGHIENMGVLGGILKQVRAQPEYQKNEAGLFVLDSGDQFQGTLISNYDEGETVFKILNDMNYDAIIPGNHDYDFGPKNWQYDRVTPGVTSNNPREVIESLSGMAKFPMISANTYLRKSIKIASSVIPVAVDDSCVPKDQSLEGGLDFQNAQHPAFLSPYSIIKKAGVRVALIGIDFHLTTSVTTGENVSDLCFRDEAATYLEVRKSLEGKADVFVLLMHNGNVLPKTFAASDIVKKINAELTGAVDLVAAGHTHQVHNNLVGDVHVIQDGANAMQYGRVDLYVDSSTHKVIPNKTNSWAGLTAAIDRCDILNASFACSQLTLPIERSTEIEALVTQARQNVASISKQKLATSLDVISVKRLGESALGDILTDELRKSAGTQIAFMNAGGIRAQVKKGDLRYENLFEILPFGNLAVVMDALPWKNLKAILERTILTNGAFGTLNESGLRIEYASSDPDDTTQLFTQSELQHVETIDGTILFDKASNFSVADDQAFSVVTLDFLSTGGDSYDFANVKVTRTLKIARDMIAEGFSKATTPTILENKTDGRFVNTAE